MFHSEATQSYKVRHSNGLEANEPLLGTFACSSGDSASSLLDAIDSLDQSAITNGILPVIPEERWYSNHQSLIPNLIMSGVRLSGIVTFGVTGTERHEKGSHLTIICRELDIPLCIARTPRKVMREKESRLNLYHYRLKNLHGTAGRIILSSNGKKVKLAANQ